MFLEYIKNKNNFLNNAKFPRQLSCLFLSSPYIYNKLILFYSTSTILIYYYITSITHLPIPIPINNYTNTYQYLYYSYYYITHIIILPLT